MKPIAWRRFMTRGVLFPTISLWGLFLPADTQAAEPETLFPEDIDVHVPSIADDPLLSIDYDIVYVRAQRAGDEEHRRFYTDFSQPVTFEPGADLMLLHPDGSEELLVEGGDGSVTDPMMSFDGEWVYYTLVYDLVNHNQWNPPRAGADIYKLHLPTRRIVRLTNQQFTPNTGAADWSSDYRTPEEGRTHYDYGVFNMGPCPLPGGRIAFTSNRDGFEPAKGYPTIALQLFVMDDRDESIGDGETPQNLEKIGHLNISGALHPVVLTDGRIMFSTLESQGIRSEILWGLWTIHPDGANWAPLVSAFDPGGAPNGFHFQTQLSNGDLVFEEYYNQNNSGFGAYLRMPPSPPDGYAAFGPAWMNDPRNEPWRYGRFYNAKPQWYRMPFMPTGSVSMTPFSHGREGPADPSVFDDKDSPRVGKFTHPSGAPDNHLLTIYSPGPVNHQYKFLPQLDGGIYLLPEGRVIESPSELRLIRNDPDYNESWPRAVVPYSRIYGVDEPVVIPPVANDGRESDLLPAGTPFGLVGTSSFYKRESYPNGVVPEGAVTAEYPGGNDPWRGLDAFTSHGNGMPLNWHNQGGDAGLYSNDEIHAVRILVMEPTTDRHRGADTGTRFHSHANERLRILGEIPLRKFGASSEYGQTDDGQPLDPDGNPDTSFLARIPADTAFTFQTLDRDGLLLNMSQTWHQLRPGEIRTDCGGCHAHSQTPTLFEQTFAARDDYQAWDLVNSTPLITASAPSPLPQGDEVRGATPIGGEGPGVRGPSGDSVRAQRWDAEDRTQLQFGSNEVLNVEYHRDIRPIFERSCIACHSSSDEQEPAAGLDLGADDTLVEITHNPSLPGTYYRLAADEKAQFGPRPFGYDSWGYPNASRYIRMFQARRSLLVWKLFGRRLDGFTNDDHPSESEPGSGVLTQAGEPVDGERNRARWDLDYRGQQMPPDAAVREGRVAPLTDEDRRTILRWIDLGCPLDLDYDPEHPDQRGRGWMLDDNRPVLTIAEPAVDSSEFDRILIGMHDYGTGLDLDSFSVTSDIALDGIPAGTDLADRFQIVDDGVWEWRLDKSASAPLVLTVSVRDGQGNTTTVERALSPE